METSLSKYASVTSRLKAIAPTAALSVPKIKYKTLRKKHYLMECKMGSGKSMQLVQNARCIDSPVLLSGHDIGTVRTGK